MSNLMDKLQKSGAIKHASVLSDSKLFNVKESVPTQLPIVNIALSGDLDGGLSSGLTFLAGESKSFKSLLGLMMVKSYLDAHKDAICIFYDSEFGTTPKYFESNGIDPDRVLHVPIEHLEQLKFDISKRLDSIDRVDKVIFFIDSVGNLASKKEVEDALDGNTAADMTRAKVFKSLWRIVTPNLTVKDIPCVAINHTYKTMELYSKNIMSGGTGGMYSANQVFIISKAQDTVKKSGKTLLEGYKFTINIEKSRFVREKSKFPFIVKFDGGINKWTGLLDIALESGAIISTKKGYYSRVDLETGEVEDLEHRAKKMNTADFWSPVVNDPKFKEWIRNRYQMGNESLMSENDEDDYVIDNEEDDNE